MPVTFRAAMWRIGGACGSGAGRMRRMFGRPVYVLLLWVLVPLTVVILFAVQTEVMPHDDDVCVSWEEVIDRPAAYVALPSYDLRFGFDVFDSGDRTYWFGSRYWSDYPYWPDGDPGLGIGNPLPPKVKRWHIDGVRKELVLLLVPILWSGWGFVFAWHRLRGPARGRGFAVSSAVSVGAAREGSGRE